MFWDQLWRDTGHGRKANLISYAEGFMSLDL